MIAAASSSPLRWGWPVIGLLWIAASTLPWATQGLLARSSVLDLARMSRSDSLAGTAVATTAPWVLLLPCAGIGLLAITSREGPTWVILRWVLGAVGAVVIVAIWLVATGGRAGRTGAGAWMALLGAGAVLVVSLETKCRRTHTRVRKG